MVNCLKSAKNDCKRMNTKITLFRELVADILLLSWYVLLPTTCRKRGYTMHYLSALDSYNIRAVPVNRKHYHFFRLMYYQGELSILKYNYRE